tara:strand:+ start:99 stop:503 length:405 start_codon:yes stop_codon:yes gene_type:complete
LAKSDIVGFRVAEIQPPKPDGSWGLYEIEEVSWNGRNLTICMNDKDREISICFDMPVSFRSQDEGDMLGYWSARSDEKVAVAAVYTIEKSPYLDWIKKNGVTALRADLRHWLIAGLNQCVEVICEADEVPSIIA